MNLALNGEFEKTNIITKIHRSIKLRMQNNSGNRNYDPRQLFFTLLFPVVLAQYQPQVGRREGGGDAVGGSQNPVGGDHRPAAPELPGISMPDLGPE